MAKIDGSAGAGSMTMQVKTQVKGGSSDVGDAKRAKVKCPPRTDHATRAASGHSRYLIRRDAKLAWRIAGYEKISDKNGYTKPGSNN